MIHLIIERVMAAGWAAVIIGVLAGEKIGWAFARLAGVRRGHEDDDAIAGARDTLAGLERRAEQMIDAIQDLDGMYAARRRALDRLRADPLGRSRAGLPSMPEPPPAPPPARAGGARVPCACANCQAGRVLYSGSRVVCARCLIPLTSGFHTCAEATPADRELAARMAEVSLRYGTRLWTG